MQDKATNHQIISLICDKTEVFSLFKDQSILKRVILLRENCLNLLRDHEKSLSPHGFTSYLGFKSEISQRINHEKLSYGSQSIIVVQQKKSFWKFYEKYFEQLFPQNFFLGKNTAQIQHKYSTNTAPIQHKNIHINPK